MLATLSRWRSRVQIPSGPLNPVSSVAEHHDDSVGVGGSVPPPGTGTWEPGFKWQEQSDNAPKGYAHSGGRVAVAQVPLHTERIALLTGYVLLPGDCDSPAAAALGSRHASL